MDYNKWFIFQGVKLRSQSLRLLRWKLPHHEKMLRWTVNLVLLQPAGHRVCPGTYRNLEKLLNSWFIIQTPFSQELHLDSVAVDLTVISLWPSVQSRLKMLDIITVRVLTAEQILMVSVRVIMCSHSDKESYKNLGQSESRWLNWSCSCSEEDLKLHRHTCIWNTII